MPKIVNQEEVREKIILGAFNTFIEKGYYKTNIEDISKKCQMTRTTIYYYFKSKDDIFENTVYYIIDTMENDLKQISLEVSTSVKDKIKFLNEKWESQFNSANLILILTELWLAIRRDEGEMFVRIKERIKERIKQMSHLINSLALEKAKYKIEDTKEKFKIDNSFIILSMLQQIPTQSNLVRDNLLSIIASI
jgi:AcrR family transcriptional regulator